MCRNLFYNYCFSNQPCSNFSSELSSITFKLSNTNYVIQPDGYLLSNTMGHTCVIAISYVSDSQNMYILGDTFIRNFYTVFDYQTNKVKFGISSNAPPGTKIHTVLSGWVIFAYTMTATLLILFCCIGTYCFITRCFLKRKTKPRYRPTSYVEDSDSAGINKSDRIQTVPNLDKGQQDSACSPRG